MTHDFLPEREAAIKFLAMAWHALVLCGTLTIVFVAVPLGAPYLWRAVYSLADWMDQ